MALTPRQAEAALAHDQSICVTAGAGTGKTHVLVTKYVDLLRRGGCGVGNILALTYTDQRADADEQTGRKRPRGERT